MVVFSPELAELDEETFAELLEMAVWPVLVELAVTEGTEIVMMLDADVALEPAVVEAVEVVADDIEVVVVMPEGTNWKETWP